MPPIPPKTLKPFGSTKLSRVYHGDCTEIMLKLPDQYDLVFADPPFNIGQSYNGYIDKMEGEAYAEFTYNWIIRSWICLNPNGILILHGPDLLIEMFLIAMRPFSANRIAWVNWHYRFGQCNRGNWIDARCHCLIYAKNPDSYVWNPDDVLVESDRAVVYGDKRVDETERGGKRLPGTIWGVPSDGPNWGRVQGNNSERREGHPNQLPEVYLERLLRAYTNVGSRVLDPFAGSGTTVVVAEALGRLCDTIDISEANCRSVMNRLKKGAVRVKA